MKKILFFSVLVIFSLVCLRPCGAEQQTAAPAEENAWDFGKVQETQVVTHNFVLKNHGQKVLNIKEVTTSCGCTVSTVKKKQLAPGEETTIEVKFKAKGYNGPTKQFVYVHTDDPDKPVIRFAIRANVKK
ncbi:MAG: DUF1573 domain-containing protein [Candidatus Omnitrophota bacterium]|nr:DUF1573 domain-containing protein [Candidatus Omnitrophota bacterium]